MNALNELRNQIGAENYLNGWHDRFGEIFGQIHMAKPGAKEDLVDHTVAKTALIAGEAFEAIEELRDGHDPQEIYYGPDGKPEGYPVELADALIRILDLCCVFGIDIDSAVEEKRAYNRQRGHMHGGKTI